MGAVMNAVMRADEYRVRVPAPELPGIPPGAFAYHVPGTGNVDVVCRIPVDPHQAAALVAAGVLEPDPDTRPSRPVQGKGAALGLRVIDGRAAPTARLPPRRSTTP